MSIKGILTSKLVPDAAAIAAAEAEAAAIFDPQHWGVHIAVEEFTENNYGNLWNNEMPSGVRKTLLAGGVKDAAAYGGWLGDVRQTSVSIYWKSLWSSAGGSYRQNEGWRIMLLAIPSAGVIAAGLSSHFQSGQSHNDLGVASNVLFELAERGLTALEEDPTAPIPRALPGRKAVDADWDRGGLIVAPIFSVAGVDVSSAKYRGRALSEQGGLPIKAVRTTTEKKTLASFICVEPFAANTRDAKFRAALKELEKVGRVLASSVPPFSVIRDFDAFRNAAIKDPANARSRMARFVSADREPVVRVYYGPPGTGKTVAAVVKAVEIVDPGFEGADDVAAAFARFNDSELNDQLAFITFHPSLQYEDVVESIRPLLGAGKEGGGQLSYEHHAGVFMSMAQRARENPTKDYVVVIDEINRGDIARILGPLITVIEGDKREGFPFALGFVPVYAETAGEGDRVYLPPNLHFVGAMNSADRNIALLDYALRRRFEFVHCPPDVDMLPHGATLDGTPIDIKALLTTINRRLTYILDGDHVIGHTYFMGCRKNLDVIRAFGTKVLPMLREYFYGREGLLLLVLGETVESKTADQIAKKNIFLVSRNEAELQNLFGRSAQDAVSYGLRRSDTGFSIEVNPDFWNAKTLRPDKEAYAVAALRKIYAGKAQG